MNKVDWLSERVLFGLTVILGYFLMIGTGAWFLQDKPTALALIRDAILPLATLLGVILNAVFKTDKVEKQTANTAATLAAKAPDLSTSTVGAPNGELQDVTIQNAVVVPTPNPLARKPT